MRVIDLFAIGLTHALIALACLRILNRPDLDFAGDALGQMEEAARKRRRAARAGKDVEGV